MDGSGFGRDIATAIGGVIIMAFVLGGGIAIGAFFLIRWLVFHLSLHWK